MGRQYVDDIRRAYYQDAKVFNQDFLDKTFVAQETEIQFVVDVSIPGGFLRLSDRHKYVGNDYYEGRISIPKVERQISELLSPTLTFSEIEITVNNVDGRFNHLLVGGEDYISFFGQSVELKAGIGDDAATYRTLFRGFIHYEGSVERGSRTFTLRARDEFEKLNTALPLPSINATDFPSAPGDSIGKLIPLVLGDWEAGFNFLDGPDEDIGSGVVVRTKIPNNLHGGTVGYNVGGQFFVFSIGNFTPDNLAGLVIKRGDRFLACNFATSPMVGAGFWLARVNTLQTPTGSTAYQYQSGDLALIAVKVPYAPGQYHNPVSQARHILYKLAGVTAADLDTSSWQQLETKSAITNLRTRVWIGDSGGGGEGETVLAKVLSLLEQVRLDLFVDANRKLRLLSLHLDDFPQLNAVSKIEQVHVNEDSIKPEVDRRNFFNSGAANYAFLPFTGKTALTTSKKQNVNSISKSGKEVAKFVDFPALYREQDVLSQLVETLRFYSAGLEYIRVTLAWPHLLRDLGEFLGLSYNVGSVSFDNVPVMVRSVSVDPTTASVDVRLLSFANLPYPDYQPQHQNQMLSRFDQPIT